ncbi:MAG: tRNA (adenosine(37)-N6)-threonylcarbamoyltransferase complex dimerization subunit type 1 TsaB [Tidjanibacter sp.]|nr:tRNA (adenosine(37)-N6)-threonylcarbamoyltransferase complex dimerization subunit type 1 TsaB [Tidjanibacter sp.]
MGLILCIETGTDICSAALAKDGELIALRESDGVGHDHARQIGVYVDELLRGNDLTPDDLDAVAVGKGPGSYTGLRIGVSFAKGLCYAVGIPLLAVDSLLSLAECAVEEHEAGLWDTDDWAQTVLCPMIDARRMEVYTELFDSSLNPLSQVKAEVVTAESFAETAGRILLCFGNGAQKCREVLPEARFVEIGHSARGLCRLAEQRFVAGQTEDVAYFEPFYLKDFIVTTSKKKLF